MPHDGIRTLKVIDMHAAGDVSRILLDGVPPIPGQSLLEQVRFLEREADGLRRLLLSEPYGDPSMSLDLVVPPQSPDAEAGVLIMEAMGYPAFSGSNAICTVTALLESGHLPMTEGERLVQLDCPAGLVNLAAQCRGGRVEAVTYEAVPAYVAARNLSIELPGQGVLAFDLVWSGVFYAVIDAAEFGIPLNQEDMPSLATLGAAVIEAARPNLPLRYPELGDMGQLSFVHFAGPLEAAGPGLWQSRTTSYVHPGVICRSPTGTGTSARLALHAEKGELRQGDTLETMSPFGTRFRGRLLEAGPVGHKRGFGTAITGQPRCIGRGEIVLDLGDPLVQAAGLSALFDG